MGNIKYIIGVDAGGTKTDCLIAEQNGNIISEFTGKGCNPLIDGFERSANNIWEAINECNKIGNIELNDALLLLVGSTGVGRKHHKEKLESEIKKFLNIKNVVIETDSRIAFEGAFPEKPGCILIVGTGSIIYGKNIEGEIFRSGGFGRILGDEGSGYSIGRKGLKEISKEFDGRGEKTILTDYLKKYFNISSSDELISAVYGNELQVQDFAPYVIKAAENNDKIALDILDVESDELVEHINSIKNKMNIEKLNLAFLGSLISTKNYYSELIKNKINEKLNYVNICQPDSSPVKGALHLAIKYSSQLQ